MSIFAFFFGSWRSTSSTSVTQPATVEISQSSSTLPSPPQSVAPHTHSSDPLNDFFGTSPRRGSTSSLHGIRDSRHDDPTPDLPPPAYESQHPYHPQDSDADLEMGLPSYDAQEEPDTLAMYLFKYGFLFPPFWLLGTIILFLSLTAPSDFHPHKTERERNEILDVMRKAEVKWGRRCAVALVVLVVVVALVVGLVVSIKLGV
ncbi:hypothetical protein JAAARDRAFT_66628 [Jaapia argillacea MUCL 33604]|uniref:Transmembrane protein n=1 Tax=Jaapia argillacea MUCL 33604 TaxID=933084 RepID=A0A067Q3I4_9AGAM|nr:hypothetical protein JAAARDRAFT_66628 [Jaapia argillacea MUCL 33604]